MVSNNDLLKLNKIYLLYRTGKTGNNDVRIILLHIYDGKKLIWELEKEIFGDATSDIIDNYNRWHVGTTLKIEVGLSISAKVEIKSNAKHREVFFCAAGAEFINAE